MDIFTAIKNDHRRLCDLFDKLEQISEGDPDRCKELFNEIKTALIQHTKAEQQAVYKRLAKNEERLVEEAVLEHQQVDALLKDIAKNGKVGDVWQAKVLELRRNLEHHAKMEETELFDRIREAIPQEELDEMGKRFRRFKEAGARGKRASAKRSHARR